MATTKEYKDFVLEQLSILESITCRSMMGEYLLYYNGILFGGIYDNRLLLKKVEKTQKYHMEEVVPYQNAKLMYHADFIDDPETLKRIILATCEDLSKKL